MANEELLKNIASGIFTRLDEIASSIDYAGKPEQADGTNWTVADSLSNIAHSLERIANSLEQK